MERAKAVFDKLSRFAALWKRRGAEKRGHRGWPATRQVAVAVAPAARRARAGEQRGALHEGASVGSVPPWAHVWRTPANAPTGTQAQVVVRRPGESAGGVVSDARPSRALAGGSGGGRTPGLATVPSAVAPRSLPSVDVPPPRRRPRPRNPFAEETRRSREAHGIVVGIVGGGLTGAADASATPVSRSSRSLNVSSARRRPRVPMLSPTPLSSASAGAEPPPRPTWPFAAISAGAGSTAAGDGGRSTATPRTWAGDGGDGGDRVFSTTPWQADTRAQVGLVTPSSLPPPVSSPPYSTSAHGSGVPVANGHQHRDTGVVAANRVRDTPGEQSRPKTAAGTAAATDVHAPSPPTATLEPAHSTLVAAADAALPTPATPVTATAAGVTPQARADTPPARPDTPGPACRRQVGDSRGDTMPWPRIDPARIPELVAQLEGFVRTWAAKKAAADKAMANMRELEAMAVRYVPVALFPCAVPTAGNLATCCECAA